MRHLRLDQQQESELVLWIEQRVNELKRENKERIDADKESTKTYENEKSERAKLGGVYAESNMPVPLTCCVVDHFASRSEDELFERKPMCSFAPEGPADRESARGLDRWANFKLFKQGGVRDDLLESNHSGFRHRAVILKAIYDEDFDMWEEHDVSVLHNGADKSPVLILEHGYVIEGRDKFMEVVDPVTQQPMLALEADPTVVLDPTQPEKYFFAPLKKPIRFKDVFYSGPKSREVDSDCFLAPIEARCLGEADMIAEFFDKPVHWMKARFLDRPWLKWADFENKVSKESGSRKTEDERKKLAKESRGFDWKSGSFGIIECWIERDVLGWGFPQRIVVWYERKTKTLIDYEYQKKVTPHGRHPYTAIAVAKHKNYWWGPSIPEMMKPFQEYVDKQWNRKSFRNSVNANPYIAQNPEAIAERKSFLDMQPFEVVTLEPGKTIQDWLQAFVIPNADIDTEEMINKAIEWVYFWLGISNIARGDYSDVPQNTTLGGQEASLKEAGKLSKRWTRRITIGLEDHLTKLVQIALATMNPEEVYTYLEGDVEQMGFITENTVKDMTVNARLIVSKDSSTQKLQEQQMTLQTVTQYLAYPPQMQYVIRPIMKSMLFLLGHDDVEALLPPPMVPGIDPVTGQTVMVPYDPSMAPPAPVAAPNTEKQAGEEGGEAAPGAAAPAAVVPFDQNAGKKSAANE